jgi:uncharacterized surface protein with fasciclin (FAS1) repeats
MMPGMTVAEDGYSYMSSDPNLTTWVQLIDAGGLQQYARGAAPYTVFPASDQAFAAFPDMVKSLLGYQYSLGQRNGQNVFPDTSTIVKLVRSHVIAGKHYPTEVMGKVITVTSVAGTPVKVDGTDPSAVTVSWTSAAGGGNLSAKLIEPPVTCVNAVIYVVNSIEKM